jgi:hypothetical protein
MRSNNPKMILSTSILFLVCWIAIIATAAAGKTALDDYVWSPDSHYSWYDTGNIIEGYSIDKSHHWKGYILNMTR